MNESLVSSLTESAVRLDPRDSREYAGNQEDSPLYDICEHPEQHDNVRDYDDEIVVVDDANAKVWRSSLFVVSLSISNLVCPSHVH